MTTQVDAHKLLSLLEASDLSAVEEIEELINNNLTQSKETWLLYGLVDSFMVSHSSRCMEILAGVQEPHDKHLFDRLLEHLRGSNKLQALTLLGYLVRKQPPWFHKIARHQLLPTIIKVLKTEIDVIVLMSGVLLITSMLPLIPVLISPHLAEIFEVFTRLAAFNLRKPAGHVPDVYLLHLQVGVYALFHRLYGMYPCNLLTYLRASYNKKDNQQVFEKSIQPMLSRVRMHPLLVTASKDKEVSTDRWRRKEVHDIMVECAKLSLDLIEGMSEEVSCPIASVAGMRLGPGKYREIMAPRYFDRENRPVPPATALKVESQPIIVPAANSLLAAQESAGMFWSPSMLCGMSTPPPASATTQPTGGADTHSAASTSLQGTQANTPHSSLKVTPRESPLPHDDLHPAALDKPPTTPGGSAVSGWAGGSGGGSVGVATTTASVSSTAASNVCTTSTSHLTTSHKRLSAISMSLAGAVRRTPPSDVTCNHDGANTGVFPGDTSTPASPLKPEFTAEPPLTAQRMHAIRRITFDEAEQAVEATEEIKPVRKHGIAKISFEKSTESVGSVKAEEELHKDASDGRKLELSDEQAMQTQVPSVSQLSQFIDSLDVHKDPLDKSQEADEEVSAITRERTDTSETSDSSEAGYPSHIPANVELTAESVAAFMKKVNRIRFNTFTAVQPRKSRRVSRHTRPNSCPSLDKSLEEEDDAGEAVTEDADADDSYLSNSVPINSHLSGMTFSRMPGGPSAVPSIPPSMVAPLVTTSNTTSSSNTSIITEVSTTVTTTVTSKSTTSTDGNVVAPAADVPVTAMSKEAAAVQEQYENIMPFIMPYAPLLYCQNCIQQGSVPSQAPDANMGKPLIPEQEPPLYSTFSPPDLLDRHIELGGEVHAKELSQIPLTSCGQISWTHFGGMPPADEVSILRGQIQLMHTQLMFERHKREMHAKRNRRLLGRIMKTTYLEEQNAAMHDQLRLQENEIQNLNIALKLEQQTNVGMKQSKDMHEVDCEQKHRAHLQQIKKLEDNNKDLTRQLADEKAMNADLGQKLLQAEAANFSLEQELQALRQKAIHVHELQEQVTRLNKELLLMGELQQRYQQRLVSLAKSHNPQPEMRLFIEVYKQELTENKKLLDAKTVQLDFAKAKLAETEEHLKQKETIFIEHKKSFEDLKSKHTAETQALEQKYNTQKKIQVALQAQMLELHHKIGTLQKPEAKSAPIEVSRETCVSIDTQTSPTLGFMGESAFTKIHRQISEMPEDVTMETAVFKQEQQQQQEHEDEEEVYEEAWAEVSEYNPAEEYTS